MPQMSPLPWVTILLFSLFMVIFISSIIYFIPKHYFNNKSKTKTNSMNIKW